jgi:hypothetical protein
MPRRLCLTVVTLFAFLLPAAGRIQAAEHYYLMVFASQAQPDLARTAHTFATFVKSSDDGDTQTPNLESHTVSWMPANLVITPRLRPEPGKNLTLAETLEWARKEGARVTVWGPYEIQRELFQRALQQIARLNSGTLAYRMIDGRLRAASASNCIHAVCDLAPGAPLTTGAAYGEEASALVAQHLKRWALNPERTYDWLIDRLGLSQYPVQKAK